MSEKKEFIKISELTNWAENPRDIDDDKFQELKNRIKRLGQIKPVIVNSGKHIPTKGEVLGGNMRLRAFRELDIEDVWVSWVHPKTEAEKIEIALTDNEELGFYKIDEITTLIQKYKADIDLTKYAIHLDKPQTLEEILREFSPDEIVEDEVPEVSDEPAISKLGEVYQLGRHRLMCGDSTKIEDVEKLMNGNKAKTLFTSPPYNMGGGMYENYEDDLKSQEYIDFNLKTIHTWLDFINGYLFWNISYNKNARWEFLEIMYRIIKETKLRFLEMIVWDKGHGMPITSKDMLTREYEDILLAGVSGQYQKDIDLLYVGTKYNRANFYKTEFTGTTNYWRVGTNKTQLKNHLACYPVGIPARGILMTTQKEDVVVDPFGGSGSTLIACEQTDRTCYMMELDPKYCDVIRKRYDNFITANYARNTQNIRTKELARQSS